MKEITEDDLREFTTRLVDAARADMIPKMKSSVFVMALLDGEPDIKVALEVGMSLLLEKPLIIIAAGNTRVPPRMRLIADSVIEGDSLDSMQEQAAVAVEKILRERVRRQ